MPEYNEKLHGTKLDNLEEMNKLSDIYNFLRLNREELEKPYIDGSTVTKLKQL